jgi:alpha-tubulin suppressor-like RCC1 family protein
MNHKRKNVLIVILVSIFLLVSLPVSASANRAPSQTVSEVYEHSGTWYYLQTDGRVYARGNNNSYQLGLGKDWNETYFKEPRYIGGMADVVKIAAMANTTVVLKKSGNIYYLGDGIKGVYGPFEPLMTWMPERVPGITDVIDISGTYRTLLMLKKDGTLWSIGYNRYGEAGTGSSATWINEPQQVKGLPKIKAVSAGEDHALALDVNGEVWAWGRNAYGGDVGILGTGSSQESVMKPEKVKGLDRVVQIDASGGHFSAALKADGTVWIWGTNFSGMPVGNKRPYRFMEPFKVPGLADVKAISSGGNYMIALKNDGTVWTWGDNRIGQLGLGLPEDEIAELPTKVSGLSNVAKIAAGTVGTAIQADGTVWTWGVDTYNDPEYRKNYYKNPKRFVPQKSELPKLEPPQPQLTDKELKDIVSRKKKPGEISVVINKKVIDGDFVYYDPKSKQRLIDLGVLSDHLGVHVFVKEEDREQKGGNKHFVLVREDKKIEIALNSTAAVVNGKKVNMEAPFMFKDNTYWVPLKFFANLLANPDLMPPNTKPVQWLEKERIIQITTYY